MSMQKQLSTFTWRIFNHKKDDFQKVGISFRSRSGEHFLVGSFRWFVSLVRFVGKSEPVKCFIEPEKLSIRVFAFLAGTQGFAAVRGFSLLSQPFGVSIRSLFSSRFVSLENLNLSSVFLLSIRVFAFLAEN